MEHVFLVVVFMKSSISLYTFLQHFTLEPANLIFAYGKTMAQISFSVTAQVISAFIFATRIVQFLFFLNPKFQASGHLL